MESGEPRRELGERIAGEIALSDEPGATLRKWRTDFDVSQTRLADQLDVSASVISDYESGRRESPGIGVVRRIVFGLIDIDRGRGGQYVRQFARLVSAGFESDVVLDLREYPTPRPLSDFYDRIGGEEVVSGPATISGHTVINSIQAIRQLSAEEFYRLFGQSTSRALVFTDVTTGEGPLVAMRVVTPTPNAVVLHGLSRDDLWEHAPALARLEGFSLGVVETPLEEMLEELRELS